MIPIGDYKRTTDLSYIGNYIRDNLDDEKYSCIAAIHSKSLTYYTRRPCVIYYGVDLEWIEDAAEKGDLKFFVFNLHHSSGTAGIGKFNPDGTPDLTSRRYNWEHTFSEEPNYWTDESFEKYRWIMLNTEDITSKTGLSADNPNFRLRILKED
jgi:hypothetical protein